MRKAENHIGLIHERSTVEPWNPCDTAKRMLCRGGLLIESDNNNPKNHHPSTLFLIRVYQQGENKFIIL